MDYVKGGIIIIQIGKINSLKIANFTPFGAYLDAQTGKRSDNVLLPKKQVPPHAQVGDIVEAFIYRDSENRLIATTQKPLAQVGELAYLQVTAKTKLGAFLDFGLERGLFLPFREQKFPIEVGKKYLVYIYLDKSGRLSSTTDVYEHLTVDHSYQKNDQVQGTVYRVNPEIGVFVAVDNQYPGMIPKTELFNEFTPGDRIEARVIRVREDGKLDLSPRRLAHEQMSVDAQLLIKVMQDNQGRLPIDEKASPDEIEAVFHMSKAAFKRAIGSLLKSGRATKTPDGIKLSRL